MLSVIVSNWCQVETVSVGPKLCFIGNKGKCNQRGMLQLFPLKSTMGSPNQDKSNWFKTARKKLRLVCVASLFDMERHKVQQSCWYKNMEICCIKIQTCSLTPKGCCSFLHILYITHLYTLQIHFKAAKQWLIPSRHYFITEKWTVSKCWLIQVNSATGSFNIKGMFIL